MVSLAALAGTLFAAGMIGASERRLRELDLASRSALETGGKLIQNAAKRLMAAQDEHRQEADQSAGVAGQAGSRLIGAAREVEARLRVCLDEVETRLRDLEVHGHGRGQEAHALADAGEGVRVRIAEACAAAVEAIERHAVETSRSVAGILEAATRESVASVRTAVEAGETEIANAAAALRPLVAHCVNAEGWAASVKQDIASLHALSAAMTSGLAAIEDAGRHAATWPVMAEALVVAMETMRATQQDGASQDGHAGEGGSAAGGQLAELGHSIALVEAAILARDHAAERIVEAAARTEAAADRVAAMIPHPVKGETGRFGQGLLTQVEALHADAERLAAAAGQAGVLPSSHTQVTALAADILRAMERLHATSTLLASATRGTRATGGWAGRG